jgi:branched-chain amino acid transport system substrate-binding protein
MLSRRPLLAGLAGSALAPVALIPALASGPAFAADLGIEATRIRFGQAAPLEGPAAQIGLGIRDGIAAAFAQANRGGGVRGHQLDLISRDDAQGRAGLDGVGRALAKRSMALIAEAT